MTEDKMTENERVRHLRKEELRLTMEEFAGRLGVNKSTISVVESGKNTLSSLLCRSICREFHVCEAWLRFGDGPIYEEAPADELDRVLDRYHLPRYLRGLFERYALLSEPARRELEEMILSWAEELSAEASAPEDAAIDIEAEVEEYRRELEDEARTGGGSSASGAAGGGSTTA